MYWYERTGQDGDIILSTRVRFARNLCGYTFEPILDKQSAEEMIGIFDSILTPRGYERAHLPRGVLFEKRLISREMAEKKTPSQIYIKDDVCIMASEEDHLRIQAIKPGWDIDGAYRDALAAESILDGELEFAYHEKLGYLTRCPTNLGCAMRVSVMMFLPLISTKGNIKYIEKTLSQLGLTVRGAGGEGSGADGFLYQISNKVTMGVSEEDILDNVSRAASCIMLTERHIRDTLSENEKEILKDRLLRSYGETKYAFLTSTERLFSSYKDIRLGVIMGYIPKSLTEIDTMLFENLPFHIISRKGDITVRERDKERARAVSYMLSGEKPNTVQERDNQ